MNKASAVSRVGGSAGTHHAIDFEQGLLESSRPVGLERVADIGAGIDVVDIEEAELLVARFLQRFEQLFRNLIARFGIDDAVRRIDEFIGEIHAEQAPRR
ncbi:MAG: hypothetical protein U1E67_20945 [Hyphomicrobiales bacterium]